MYKVPAKYITKSSTKNMTISPHDLIKDLARNKDTPLASKIRTTHGTLNFNICNLQGDDVTASVLHLKKTKILKWTQFLFYLFFSLRASLDCFVISFGFFLFFLLLIV